LGGKRDVWGSLKAGKQKKRKKSRPGQGKKKNGSDGKKECTAAQGKAKEHCCFGGMGGGKIHQKHQEKGGAEIL